VAMEEKIRMEFPELIPLLCTRTSMWVQPPCFSSVFAFIDGYDYARDGGPLAGFREWLIVRADRGDNLHWSGLVMLLCIPDADWAGPFTAEQEASCLQGMAGLFDEFFGFRQEHGITKIHHDHAQWLLGKRWNTRSPRKKRSGKKPPDET
jgi:hypothetical protein